jgi:hypothetical protein
MRGVPNRETTKKQARVCNHVGSESSAGNSDFRIAELATRLRVVGSRGRRSKLIYPNHRLPSWPAHWKSKGKIGSVIGNYWYLDNAAMRRQTEQINAAGVMRRRSTRLREARLAAVFNARMEKAIHVAARTVAGCQELSTTPVLASTIHAANPNGTADRALKSRSRRGKTR